MMSLKTWIENTAGEEPVEACVIGKMGWRDFQSELVPNYDAIPKGKVMSWNEASKWIDYEFDDGFGAPGCNAVYAWTASRVFFVVQYDGATSLHSVPRNPIDEMPEMPGG